MKKNSKGNVAAAVAARKSLGVFLEALQGSPCIVELDNETVIKGTLESVEPTSLNLYLSNCVSKDVYNRTRKSNEMQVRGKSVRYVHLAAGLMPGPAVRDHNRRLEIARREAYTRHQGERKREKGAGGEGEEGEEEGEEGEEGET